MKLFKSSKLLFTFLCIFFLDFKGTCADDSNCLDADFRSNTRMAMPNVLGFSSLSLGSIGFLKSLSTQAGDLIGATGSTLNVAAAFLTSYNWYVDRDDIKGCVHNVLNGMVVVSNLTSATLGFIAAGTNNPEEKNIYGVAAHIAGASGLLFKGIDLFLMPSPNHGNKSKALKQASTGSEAIELKVAVDK